MPVRPPLPSPELRLATDQRLSKALGRLYIIWLSGIAIGVVKLKVEKVQVGGVEYSIQNPEVIQGLVFLACILYYVGIFGWALIMSAEYVLPTRTFSRRFVYAALGRRKTFRNVSQAQLRIIRETARVSIKAAHFVFGTIFF